MAVANKPSALERVTSDPVSRRKLLAVTGGSTALAAFLAACGSDSSSTTTTMAGNGGGKTGTEQFGKGDVGILNYALTLEYLETAFYADVVKSGLFKGSDLEAIRKFGSEEAEHVTALTGFVKQGGGLVFACGDRPAARSGELNAASSGLLPAALGPAKTQGESFTKARGWGIA